MKMLSGQTLGNELINVVNNLKKRQKEGRTNQVTLFGYFPLPQGVSTTIEAFASPQNGWMYYSTDLHHIRAYVNSAWVTVI